MSIRKSYKGTLAATYIGHITQAVANSIIAILYLVFKSKLGITATQFTVLVSVNFGVQLLVDFLCARFMDRFNYRIPMVLAQTCAGVGFISLGVLPSLLGNAFVGFLIATVIFAIGGGMTEVMLSPIVQACPTENKQAHMNLLHSFYCWGCLLAVVVSSLFLWLVGSEYWYLLAALWAVIPLVAGILFAFVPLDRPTDQIPPEKRISFGGLFKRPIFWIFIIMMACAGASEQAMYQNAAGYVKEAIGCNDIVAGLVAPGMFALCMGLSRIVTARLNRTISSEIIMLVSGVLCAIAYALAALNVWSGLALISCALCGFSIGIFWPGTFSFAADRLSGGGTALFALLAMGGDLGGLAGPALVNLAPESIVGALKSGMLFAIIFPLGLMLCTLFLRRAKRN